MKQLLLSILFVIFALSIFGQKVLQVSEMDVSKEVRRNLGDSALVILESTMPLKFESTVDKVISLSEYRKNNLYYYDLKFPTGKKYSNRELTITSDGFYPDLNDLNLQAKQILGFRVTPAPNESDGSNDSTQWVCYYEYLNKGDDFFKTSHYNDAKDSYLEAKNCSHIPTDNNLEKKIEDADACSAAKVFANSYFYQNNYMMAKQEYEKIIKLNPNDTDTKERILLCDSKERERILAEQKAEEEKKIAEQKAKEKEERLFAEQQKIIEAKLAKQNMNGHYLTFGSSLLSSGYYGCFGLGYEYRYGILGVNFSAGLGYDFGFYSKRDDSYTKSGKRSDFYVNANVGFKLYWANKTVFLRNLYFNFIPFCYFGQGKEYTSSGSSIIEKYPHLFGVGLFFGYAPIWRVGEKTVFGINIEVGIKCNYKFNKYYLINWDFGFVLKFDNKAKQQQNQLY